MIEVQVVKVCGFAGSYDTTELAVLLSDGWTIAACVQEITVLGTYLVYTLVREHLIVFPDPCRLPESGIELGDEVCHPDAPIRCILQSISWANQDVLKIELTSCDTYVDYVITNPDKIASLRLLCKYNGE